MVGPASQLANRSRTHDFIELFQKSTSRIFEICAPLYEKGHSLKEISKITGIPYSSIHDQLSAGGVTFRSRFSVSSDQAHSQGFKYGAPPAYGYRYHGRTLEKDAVEYPILRAIHRQWLLGQSATAITHFLNGQGFKTRNQKEWKRTTILNILERLEKGILVPQEDS